MRTYKFKYKLWLKYYAVNNYFMISDVKGSVIGLQIKYENL